MLSSHDPLVSSIHSLNHQLPVGVGETCTTYDLHNPQSTIPAANFAPVSPVSSSMTSL